MMMTMQVQLRHLILMQRSKRMKTGKLLKHYNKKKLNWLEDHQVINLQALISKRLLLHLSNNQYPMLLTSQQDLVLMDLKSLQQMSMDNHNSKLNQAVLQEKLNL